MSNIYELFRRDDLVDEAGDWLAMLDRGLTEQEQTALQKWLVADPENLRTLMEMASIWDKMNSLARLADMFPQTVNQQPKLPRFFALAFTVSVLLAVVGFWGVFNLHSTGTIQAPGFVNVGSEQVFQTAAEQSTVNLSDGSQLILNKNSLIRATFTDHQRQLVLEYGEVFIDVAHDTLRPLRVYIGDKVVEAVGTAFNLKFIRNQQIELIVTEGKVLVNVSNKDKIVPEQHTIPAVVISPVLMAVSAGEQILLGDTNEELQQIEPEEIKSRLSWRELNFVFHGETLADALAKIQRYTFVDFVILEQELKDLRVVGLFKADDIDGLLITLRENFGISHEYINNNEKIILTRK